MIEVAVKVPKTPCPICGKRVRGQADHKAFVHDGVPQGEQWKRHDDRILTPQEIDSIDLRADIDYLQRKKLPRERMVRAMKDRQMLLGHIRALGPARQTGAPHE